MTSSESDLVRVAEYRIGYRVLRWCRAWDVGYRTCKIHGHEMHASCVFVGGGHERSIFFLLKPYRAFRLYQLHRESRDPETNSTV